MPPTEKTKTTIKITTRFTDEQGGRLYGPGNWDVDSLIASRLIEQGRATKVGESTVPAALTKKPDELPPDKTPRIPEMAPKEVVFTELPEGFPSRDLLIRAGFNTIERLRAPNIKEELAEVNGLGPAFITKIGLAISDI